MKQTIKTTIAAIFGITIGISSVYASNFEACEEACLIKLSDCFNNNGTGCIRQYNACVRGCSR